MSNFISPIFWYIITIGILVTVHEYGHYRMARACGVHVLRFSIGFGRAIWKKPTKSGTEFQLGIIPLGGYVQMLDEREHEVPEHLLPHAFNRQSVQKRFAIVLAGPMANLFLCVAFLWAAFCLGKLELKALIATPTGISAASGLQAGDTFQAIDGKIVQGWNDALPILAMAAMDHRDIPVQVQQSNGDLRKHVLPFSRLNPKFDQEHFLDEIGIKPYIANPEPIVGWVQGDGASKDVLQIGDRILRINEVSIRSFPHIAEVLAVQSKPNENLRLEVLRDQQELRVYIAPNRVLQDKKSTWRLGIGSLETNTRVQYGLLPAFKLACQQTAQMTLDSFSMIGRLITGSASSKNLSGPISIARAADNQAAWGFSNFLSFLAAISLALCIMNLLPIPLLDGGHLLYYAIEWVTGKPISETLQLRAQTVGMVLLAGLFGIAIFNDFFRIIS